MYERFFVKPVSDAGEFTLAIGHIRQDGSLREIWGQLQFPTFRSFDEACVKLFGTTDLRVAMLNLQRRNTPLLQRMSLCEVVMVLNRSVQEQLLPQATPSRGQIMIAQRMGTCSPSEADQALATLGF